MKGSIISSQALAEEEQKMKQLRAIVDLTAAVLRQGNLSLIEAIAMIRGAKKQVLHLFPDKEEAFDLIYKPRFERILREQLESN
ncbi:MAG: hypothetical protein ONB16_02725 [candidate division KSB1 bacterium]|nr:hypothetical protein [candidate division KSB1 bacterium]MDZ7317846.1 hypothetical protein [candidate division KSB1 bacterium]MDZ7340340.1 hypothetical protein [candidate division KSB1 bacterium]